MSEQDLYKKRVFQYFRDERFSGQVQDPDFSLEGRGVLCADRVFVSGKKDGQAISQIKFDVKGCLIATACANMLGEFVSQKSVDQVFALDEKTFIDDIAKIPVQTSRRECALLAMTILKKALL